MVRELNTKWMACGVSAVAATAIGSAAHGAIVVGGPVTASGAASTVFTNIDLDGDGTNNLSITSDTQTTGTNPTTTPGYYLKNLTNNNTPTFLYAVNPNVATTGGLVANLTPNTLVGPLTAFSNSESNNNNYLAKFDNTTSTRTVTTFPNDGTTGYIGFEFPNNTKAGQIDYGWMAVQLGSFANGTFTVSQYAYDDTGSSILVGQTSVPEPMSFAAIAVGAAAAATGRRRRTPVA